MCSVSGVLRNKTVPATEEKQDECDAIDFLVSTISESIFSRVLDATTANDV
jgi:hypothetical protein